jgi:uncharacterized protein (TIRG00374 family)
MYKRLSITFLICFFAAILLGIIASHFLIRHYQIDPWNPRLPAILPLLILLTLIGLLFRFWRWHYFLRRSGIRIPTRDSLQIYLSAFSQTVIPLFIGEIALKSILIKRHSDTPFPRIILIVAYERLLDLLTLAILTIPYLLGHRYQYPVWAFSLILLVILTAIPAIRKAIWQSLSSILKVVIRWLVPDSHEFLRDYPLSIASTGVTATAMIFSLISWLMVASILPLAAFSLGGHVSWSTGIGGFALSTMAGGVTLLPGSVGITGSAMATMLVQEGMTPSLAGLTALTTRLSTFGLVFLLGLAVLAIYLYRNRSSKKSAPKDAFRYYEHEFAPDARDYYVEKKINLTRNRLNEILQGEDTLQHPKLLADVGVCQHAESRWVLDLGCGPGWYFPMLENDITGVVGIDSSMAQLRLAKGNFANSILVAGDICRMPYHDDSFDIAYGINIFHHLSSMESQQQTFQEIHRILRTEGLLILHEMNPTNPVFRFYLRYILPLFNRIDQGVEIWIDPRQLRNSDPFHLMALDYFTFLPDFVPKWLIGIFSRAERSLENSGLRKFSAHYMAVLQK